MKIEIVLRTNKNHFLKKNISQNICLYIIFYVILYRIRDLSSTPKGNKREVTTRSSSSQRINPTQNKI